MTRPVYLHSFAKALPPRCVTNHDLSTMMETSNDWIVQRTGIETRYWVTAPQTTSDLATESSQRTIDRSGGMAIDAIIAATLSSDFSFPGIGVQIQNNLKLSSIPAYDLRNQCAGFLYAVELAASLVKSQQYETVLIVGAEVHSTGLDISTRGRDLAVLFGDGAGSCLVSSQKSKTPGNNYEYLTSELHSDGAFMKELWCEHPGSAHFPTRITPELIEGEQFFPQMNGRVVFQHAVKRMTECSLSVLKKENVSAKDVGTFIPHQANLRINLAVAEHLSIPPEAVFSTIQKYGNTTAATVPIGFTDAEAAGVIKSQSLILSAAFGSGFVWGAAVFKAL